MTDDTRYVEMACACGTDWIEDRLEPGPSCPICGHLERWASLADCDQLFAEGPGEFDLAASDLIGLLKNWGFYGSLRHSSRGQLEVGRWKYQLEDQGVAREVIVELTVHKGEDKIKSVLLSLRVNRNLCLKITPLSVERLHEIVAAIARTNREYDGGLTVAGSGRSCPASTETS